MFIGFVRFTHLVLKCPPGTWNSMIPVWQECVVSGLRNPSPGLTRNSDLNHPWLVLSSPQEQAVWILDLTLISWEHVVQPSVTHVERRQTTLKLNMSLYLDLFLFVCLFSKLCASCKCMYFNGLSFSLFWY